jgi:flagellar basal body rod protein FlgG
MQSLDVVANNLANATTAGFKADHSFQMAMSDVQQGGLSTSQNWTDFTQGSLKPTGSSSDLALGGPGLFVVTGKSGPLYTRNGNFSLSPGGEFLTPDGNKLQGAGGGTIKVDPARPFAIGVDGTVSQDGVAAGQIAVVEFDATNALQKQGGSYYRATAGQAPKPSTSRVIQASLESSNVGAAESSVEMIGIMRQFESLQKALTLHTEMDKRTVESTGRTTAG